MWNRFIALAIFCFYLYLSCFSASAKDGRKITTISEKSVLYLTECIKNRLETENLDVARSKSFFGISLFLVEKNQDKLKIGTLQIENTGEFRRIRFDQNDFIEPNQFLAIRRSIIECI
jgi:hypothetical protein